MEASQLCKILAAHPFFQDLAPEEMGRLVEGHRFRNLKHHEALFVAGETADQFAVVLTGAFKLVRPTPRGEDAIMYFATPGDLIGALVMPQPGSRYPISAISLGPSTALLLPRATYQREWAQSPVVQARLNAFLHARMRGLQEDKANSKLALQQKIAALLLKLMGRYPGNEGSKLPIPLTRQEIADSVGATVESVIRSMSELSQRGIIRTEDKQIEILRPDKIAEIVRLAP
jgi:CRP/FNR family transcriptional regulator